MADHKWALSDAPMYRLPTSSQGAGRANEIRAAIYIGEREARVLTDEDDPANPNTWTPVSPGDRVAVAVDSAGSPTTYEGDNGLVRDHQYPIGEKEWEALGYEPLADLPTALSPVISCPGGPVHWITNDLLSAQLKEESGLSVV